MQRKPAALDQSSALTVRPWHSMRLQGSDHTPIQRISGNNMTPNHQNALHPVTIPVPSAGLTIEGFSISGVATWIVVPELDVMFDAGECPLSAVPVNTVFLSHIHGDHARCLPRHWQLRRMFRMAEATYYVPPDSIDGFREITRIEAGMEGIAPADVEYPNLRTLPDDLSLTQIRKGVWARSFPVTHRVRSVGYTIGRTVQKLRPEYAHLTGPEIGALRKGGTVITDAVDTPLVTFIGDCIGQSLIEQSHIFESKIVILECTYVEDEDQENATAHGHTHLRDIVEVLSHGSAPACEALILKHFSLKSDPKRVRELVEQMTPPEWKGRVHVFLPPVES